MMMMMIERSSSRLFVEACEQQRACSRTLGVAFTWRQERRNLVRQSDREYQQ
jgi:hypothetical protein